MNLLKKVTAICRGRGSTDGSVVKNLPPTQKTQGPRVQSWGWEVSLEQEMATHSSILAWRIPWTEEPGGLQSMGLQRAGHDSTAQARMEMLQRSSFRRVLLDPGRGLISAPPIPSRNLDHPHPTQPHCVSGQLGGGGSPLEKRSEAGRAAAAASLLTPPRCVPLLHPSEAGQPLLTASCVFTKASLHSLCFLRW